MITYEVLEYVERDNCHKVKDASGVTRLVDLMVNGDFPEGTDPQSLVGRFISCEYEFPYIAIAMHVQT